MRALGALCPATAAQRAEFIRRQPRAEADIRPLPAIVAVTVPLLPTDPAVAPRTTAEDRRRIEHPHRPLTEAVDSQAADLPAVAASPEALATAVVEATPAVDTAAEVIDSRFGPSTNKRTPPQYGAAFLSFRRN